MLGRKLVVLSLLAFGVAAVACLDDSTPLPSDLPYYGPQSPCTTGPALANDTKFPQGPLESGEPVCVPRCGAHPELQWTLSTGAVAGPSPLLEAVPNGACTYVDEACSMVAVRQCCPGQAGEGLLVECHCVNDAWSCAAAFAPGAIGCPAVCPSEDAGTGTDGGSDAGDTADAGDGGDASDGGDAGDAGDD